jgi:RAVE protein 1 C terminal
MRSFYILNQRASAPSSPESNGGIARRTGRRERLRYRDMIWAFHSESQGLLLAACTSACGGKMTWADARALGVFLWLNSLESMVRTSCALCLRLFTLRWALLESRDGDCSTERIYGRRCTGPCRLFTVLLRIGETQARAWALATGCMAQGTDRDAQVPVQRFFSASLAHSRTEERLCITQQAAFW